MRLLTKREVELISGGIDDDDDTITVTGDPDQLTFYVVDGNGDLRQYDYTDKAIYDVPVEQLLGQTGTPPPLPDPVDTNAPACPA